MSSLRLYGLWEKIYCAEGIKLPQLHRLETGLQLAARLVLGIVGVLLLYSATLYEDGTKKLISYLELLWVRIDELHRLGKERSSALIKVASEGIAQFFERTFGRRLLSPQGVASSLVFPLAPFLVTIGVFVSQFRQLITTGGLVLTSAILVFVFGAFLTPLSFLFFTDSPKTIWISTFALICFELTLCVALWQSERKWIIGFVVGALSAIMLISFNRKLVQWCAASDSTAHVLAAAVLNLLAVTLLCVTPWWYGRRFQPTIDRLQVVFDERLAELGRLSTPDIEEVLNPYSDIAVRVKREREGRIPQATEALRMAKEPLGHYKASRNTSYMIAICNLGSILVAMSTFILLGILVVHRVTWSVVAQMLYPLSQYGVFENRKFLATTGLSLLGLAAGSGKLNSILSLLR